jgi:hypothetical protein
MTDLLEKTTSYSSSGYSSSGSRPRSFRRTPQAVDDQDEPQEEEKQTQRQGAPAARVEPRPDAPAADQRRQHHEQIENRKEKNPDQIDKVPVQPGHFHAVGVLPRLFLPHLRAGSEQIGEHDHPTQDVQPVKSRHHVVDRVEGVGRGGEVPWLNLLPYSMALMTMNPAEAAEERGPEKDLRFPEITQPQARPRENDRDARSDQDEGVQCGQRHVEPLPAVGQ